jgi:hypothetical protein
VSKSTGDMDMAGHIYFDGLDRDIVDTISLPTGHKLLILSYPLERTIAVRCIQFETSGLYTDMDLVCTVKDIDAFKAKIPVLIDVGFFE